MTRQQYIKFISLRYRCIFPALYFCGVAWIFLQPSDLMAKSPQYEISASQEENSDDLKKKNILFNYDSNRSDIFFPYNNEPNSLFSIHALFIGNEINSQKNIFKEYEFHLGFSYKFSKHSQIKNLWGIDTLTNESISQYQMLTYQVQWNWFPNEDFFSTFELKRNSIGKELSGTAALTKHIYALDTAYNFTYMPHKKIRLNSRNSWRTLSDKNKKTSHDLSFMYGISPGWPWIWSGVGAEYNHFQDKTIDYWSPSQFYSYGLRNEASFPIKGEWSGLLALNLSITKEENYPSGKGYYGSLGIQYGDRNKNYLRCFYNRIISQQETSQWVSDNVQINTFWEF